tara:strand:- start:2413 stop:2982 length:570 start_codon:yes stop_codon:yes gene_type:complete
MGQKTSLFFILFFLSMSPLRANDEQQETTNTQDEFSEIRLGISAHDLNSKMEQSHERGMSLNGEYIFASPQNAFFQAIFAPHPHIGASLNSSSGTSIAYAGLTWVIPFQQVWFIDLAWGVAVQNGNIHSETKKKKAYGARVLCHTGGSLGYVLVTNHTVSVKVDHVSNGGLSRQNPGFTDLGLRYGYRF